MEIIPLGPGFAAELRGVTLADVAADDAAYAAVRAAFEDHSVLLFRGQEVTRRGPARLLAPLRSAGSDQGRLARHRHAFRHPHHHRRRRQGGAARITAMRMRNKANQLWHTDSSFKARAGADLGALGAHHSGARRRDRIRLDPARLRAARSGAAARNSRIPSPGTTTRHSRGKVAAGLATPEELAALPPQCWRLVWTQSGQRPRRALHRLARLRRSKAWSRRRARQLIDELTAAATAPGTTYEHKWQQRRRRHVGQPRHHASRPAVARATSRATWCAPRSRRPRPMASRPMRPP